MFFLLRPPHSGRLLLHGRQFTRLLLSSVPFALPFLCVFLSTSSSGIALLFDTLFPLPLSAQASHLQRHLTQEISPVLFRPTTFSQYTAVFPHHTNNIYVYPRTSVQGVLYRTFFIREYLWEVFRTVANVIWVSH